MQAFRRRFWFSVASLFTCAQACSVDPPAASVKRQAPVYYPTTPTGGSSPSGSGATPAGGSAGRSGSAGITGTGGNKSSAAGTGGKGAAGKTAAADAGPMLPTVCASDADAGSEDDAGAAAPRDCAVVSDLHVQYLAADTNAGDNQIKPHFNLVNHGTRTIDLADLALRYWYKEASSVAEVFNCDYAQIGCANVHGAFVATSRSAANRYVELTFTSGSLGAGAQSGEIQARLNKMDWSVYDESDDYSFDPSKSAFADWYKVTLYRRGVLVWGQEPQ